MIIKGKNGLFFYLPYMHFKTTHTSVHIVFFMYAFVPLTPELFSLVIQVEIEPLTLAPLLYLLQDYQHSAAIYLLHK